MVFLPQAGRFSGPAPSKRYSCEAFQIQLVNYSAFIIIDFQIPNDELLLVITQAIDPSAKALASPGSLTIL